MGHQIGGIVRSVEAFLTRSFQTPSSPVQVQCSAQLFIGFYGAEVADVVADVPKSDDPTAFFWQTLAVTKEL